MAGEECLICGEGAPEELACKLCNHHIHFQCAFGAPVNNEKTRTFFRNGAYACPLCVVSKDNQLILKAVSNNQKYIAAKSNVTDFALPDSFFDENSENEEDSSVSVNDIQSVGTPDACTLNLHPDLRYDNFTRGVIGTPPPRRSHAPTDFFTEGMVGIPPANSPDQVCDYTPVHPRDLAVAKRLTWILNSIKNVPAYRSTVIIGDSNGHFAKQSEIDPESRSVAMRAVSGLCVVSAAQALREYRYTYKHVKKLVWCIGPNDYLHMSDHCEKDWPYHLRSLVDNSARIFPNASVTFILPFSGLPSVPTEFNNEFHHQVKLLKPMVKPKVSWLTAPSMKNKVQDDGVHLNRQGKEVFITFLRKHFTKIKNPNAYSVSSELSGGVTHRGPKRPTRGSFRSPSSDSSRPRRESFRVSQPDFPVLPNSGVATQQRSPAAPGQDQRQSPWHSDQEGQVLKELQEAISHMMMFRRFAPQQGAMNFTNR